MESTISLSKIKGWSEEMVLADVKRRIKMGEDINLTEGGGTTSVMSAASKGYASVVKLLIDAGANLALKNKWKDDVISCAKLSGNKELINFIKAAAKAGGAAIDSAPLYFRPKKGTEAEYTFYPSTQFKRDHESEENDVGFFLNESEVLKLEPIKNVTSKGRVMTIYIDEGKVTLHPDAWDTLDEKSLKPLLSKSTVVFHDIDRIVYEYLSD